VILPWGGGDQPKRRDDHSSPYRVEVKNIWSFTSTTLWCLHGTVFERRDIFIFTSMAYIKANFSEWKVGFMELMWYINAPVTYRTIRANLFQIFRKFFLKKFIIWSF
jgi:hypothetical protein